jgi:hypothetical protein
MRITHHYYLDFDILVELVRKDLRCDELDEELIHHRVLENFE